MWSLDTGALSLKRPTTTDLRRLGDAPNPAAIRVSCSSLTSYQQQLFKHRWISFGRPATASLAVLLASPPFRADSARDAATALCAAVKPSFPISPTPCWWPSTQAPVPTDAKWPAETERIGGTSSCTGTARTASNCDAHVPGM